MGRDAAEPRETRVVRRAIDGDTLELDGGERVRLIGVDAPEDQRWRNFVEPYGAEATIYMRRLVSGRRVRLEYDAERRDDYGRTLAYVFLEDGLHANAALIREGLARARRYGKNGARLAELRSAENDARSTGKGIWSKKKSVQAVQQGLE